MRAILTYHSIDDSGSPISIAPEDFARHVRFLASGAVRVLPLAELLTHAGDEHAVALTFDDGFQNFADEAWPRLAEHGLPATVYVVADKAGGTNDWENGDSGPVLPLMDWETLGKLAGEGLELGGHGRTHVHLDGLSAERLSDEVGATQEAAQKRVGQTLHSFAYPYGSFDEATEEVVGECFDNAVTTELRTLRGGEASLRLPRLDAYYLRRRGRLEAFGRSSFRRYLALRALGRNLRARIRPAR